MSATDYFTYGATIKRTKLPPEIKFRNVNTYSENYGIKYYDYALFRFNIVVQTANLNNEPIQNSNDEIKNFSNCCTGNMQIYPTAFHGTQKFTLDNFIDGSDTYEINNNDICPHGRMIYCTDTIFNDIQETLLIKCSYSNGNATLSFDFDPYTDDTDYYQLQLIYTINIELLNSGKIPMHCISTNNFQINI